MENQESSVESLVDRIKTYLETRIELLKLKAIDKSSSFLSLLITMVVMIMVGFVFFLFLNIGIALLLGNLLGKAYYGFFIVAGFYIITGIILVIFRNKWLKIPIANMMIKKLME